VPLDELELERDPDAARALAVLTESRLLTVDEGTVEVAHEALLSEWPRLRTWLAEDAEGRRLHHHLIGASRDWRDSDRDPSELYRGARLAAALDWAEEHDPELNELEREFLDESRAASEREAERQRRANRRLRASLAGVGVLLAAAAVAGLIAISERQGARDAATVADAGRLGAEALNEDRIDQALRLASAGAALDDSVATRSNLISTLLRSPAMIGVLYGDGDRLGPLALSPDGTMLVVGDSNGTVIAFDPATRERLGEYQIPGDVADVVSLSFSPAGDALAVGALSRTPGRTPRLHILDRDLSLRTSVPLGRHPTAPGDFFPGTVFTADGRRVVVTYAAFERAPLYLGRFDARDGSPVGRPVQIGHEPGSYALPVPGGRVVFGGEDATYLIDGETLRVVRRYPVAGAEIRGNALAPDGRTLSLGDDRGIVRLLDLVSGRVRRMRGQHGAAVVTAAFSPDGRTLATVSEDGSVIVRNPRTGKVVETLEGHRRPVWGAVFSRDGRTLYTASDDLSLVIWDVAGDRRLGRPFDTGIQAIDIDKFPPAFSVSPDGRTVAAARFDGRVDLIDAETLRSIGGFTAFEDTPATAIEYSPNGDRLAVAGGRGLIGIWDAHSGEREGPLLDAPRHGPCADPGSLFAFIPACFEATVQDALAFGSGNLLASANINGKVRIWDLDDHRQIGPAIRLPHFVVGLDFSPDGSQLAIPFGLHGGGPDGVEVVDVQSRERVARLPAVSEVRVVRYSPDGRLLATGLVDGTTQFWGTDSWRQVAAPLTIGEGDVLRIEFSPDGRTLASSVSEGFVGLWDVESQAQIASFPFPGPRDRWMTPRFTPDGRRLFIMDDNREAIRWDLDPAAWMRQACAVTGGGLTPEQWEEIVPEQDYVSACPSG
jgi:WD40 repeat protein